MPLDGVFDPDLEFGSELRLVSSLGGCGDFAGREFRDISEGDLEEGKEESDVRRFRPLPFELIVPFVEGLYMDGWTCADAMAVPILSLVGGYY